MRIIVTGAVQGVGFRPTVYRFATELGLGGWVLNSTAGVFVEVEGPADHVDAFVRRLRHEPPPRARIDTFELAELPPLDETEFRIDSSSGEGPRTVRVVPDIATCDDCLHEIFDPANRRHRYPFTNCTNCGPRYSIIESLPYDRAATTMRGFVMCERCRREYEDPLDRRFHAQPNACPACGPQLALWGPDGRVLAERDAALQQAGGLLREGLVLALKGLGGFHLMVDARSEAAVARLRERKRRHAKPLAVMFPSLDDLRHCCAPSPAELELLSSPERPIVLLDGAAPSALASGVAPGLCTIGAMLPYTPLHALLLAELGFPVVATSGNLSEEPICTDEREAVQRLHGIADAFLVHDRPIARPVDDPVAHVVLDRPVLLRIGRGYAPLAVPVPFELPPAIAFGAHLKNTVAVGAGRTAFVSQHVGDLDSETSIRALQRIEGSLRALYEITPELAACDLHPDYASTRLAQGTGLPLEQVQHHHAHVAALLAEHGVRGRTLGVSWDGTGFGPDGTVWGGEVLLVDGDAGRCERFASFRAFPLPGGDAAVKEPRRSALGLLWALDGESVLERRDLPPVAAFTDAERNVLRTMLTRGLNAPLTSSAGRIFDAVAALCGLAQQAGYEGQAAILLEQAAGEDSERDTGHYVVSLVQDGSSVLRLDWAPMIRSVVQDVTDGVPPGRISRRFHGALVECIAAVVRRSGERRVALSGGCFQNRRLLSGAVRQLQAEGVGVFWPHLVPPNDAGVALGQLTVAAARRNRALRGGE